MAALPPRPASRQARPRDADADLDSDAAYRALRTRDSRFDGRLFVGVTSTGIYCRPVCRVKLPRRENCRFFASAALAEAQGFRPCLRCRPELAPGLARIDGPQTLADAAAQALGQSVHSGTPLALSALAQRLGITDRHLRRIFVQRHGVGAQDWLLTQRLLLAKQLLTDTTLPVAQVASSAGFGSARRLQQAFATRYRLAPGQLRHQARHPTPHPAPPPTTHPAPHPAQPAPAGAAAPAAPGASASPGLSVRTGPSASNVATGSTAGTAPTGARASARSARSARSAHPAHPTPAVDSTDRLRLAWREPYDVHGLLAFVRRRAVDGLEQVDSERLLWRRTLAWPGEGNADDSRGPLPAQQRPARSPGMCEAHTPQARQRGASADAPQRAIGWLALHFCPAQGELQLSVAPALRAALPALLQRTRQVLDLDADAPSIAQRLQQVPGPLRPGVRLPGSWCGWEAAVRVLLGQQVSVAAARTLVQRLVACLGQPVDTPWPALQRLFPAAHQVAGADPAQLAGLGIVRQRVRALQALAAEVSAGRLHLHPGAPLQATLAQLRALPGIGDWSAQLIALRALAWPDAWPAADLALRKALGGVSAAQAEALSAGWRPWRAYALMQLWLNLEHAPLVPPADKPAGMDNPMATPMANPTANPALAAAPVTTAGPPGRSRAGAEYRPATPRRLDR